MSVIDIVLQANRAILVTDAAVWNTLGVVTAFTRKQAVFPSWPAVVALRGKAQALPIFARLLGNRFKSFDALVAEGERALPDMLKLACGDVEGEAVIVGWSRARNRAEAFVIRTCEPEPQELEAITYGPSVTRGESGEPAGFWSRNPTNMSEPDLLRHMTALLELQRKQIFQSPAGQPYRVVGGFALASIVTSGGVRQRVFHAWPDRAGETIRG